MNTPSTFFDPAIIRKASLVAQKVQLYRGLPLPGVIEISESGTCNRKCVFCPRSAPNFQDITEFIDPNFVNKLANELSEVGYEGLILFSGFVEPLLDKEIYSHIKVIREKLPKSRIELVTNGDVLNSDRLIQLFDSGLSTILISVYDGELEAINFEVMCKDAGLRDDQYVIRHRYLPEEDSFGITINNRSGMMENAVFPIKSLTKPLDKPCYYPHYTFFVDYLGDVLLCPHDWGKKRVVGNIKNESTFSEVWFGQAFAKSRAALGSGNRGITPCNKCDVSGELIGSAHFKIWSEND